MLCTRLSWEKERLSPENMLLRASLTLSLNRLSRASATISAALPRGHCMMGTTPRCVCVWGGGCRGVCKGVCRGVCVCV